MARKKKMATVPDATSSEGSTTDVTRTPSRAKKSASVAASEEDFSIPSLASTGRQSPFARKRNQKRKLRFEPLETPLPSPSHKKKRSTAQPRAKRVRSEEERGATIPRARDEEGLGFWSWLVDKEGNPSPGPDTYFTLAKTFKNKSVRPDGHFEEDGSSDAGCDIDLAEDGKCRTIGRREKSGKMKEHWARGRIIGPGEYKRTESRVDDKTPEDMIQGLIDYVEEDRPLYFDHARWHKYFKKYRKQCGGQTFIHAEVRMDLKYWVEKQQTMLRRGMLLEERKAKLDSVGFYWDAIVKFTWDEWLARFVAFREKHGNISVPLDTKLGRWVKRMRQTKICPLDSKRRKRLEPWQVDKLESIGFEWGRERGPLIPWDSWFKELIAYQKENNSFFVPVGGSSRRLGFWILRQRKAWRDGKMERDKFEKLESIGFQWQKVKTKKL